MKICAAIYIGSFEVIMKVYSFTKKGDMREIDALRMPLELIPMDGANASISKEVCDSLCLVLNDMYKKAEAYNPDIIKCFCGAALRNAANELFVLEQIRMRNGIDVQVISNSEQRFLNYEALANTESFEQYVKNSALLVDVGGSSLQLTLFLNSKIVTTQHIMMGVSTVNSDIWRLGNTDDVDEQVMDLLTKELDVFAMMYLGQTALDYLVILGDQLAAKEDGGIEVLTENFKFKKAQKLLYKAYTKTLKAKHVVIPGYSVCDGMAYNEAVDIGWITRKHDYEADVVNLSYAMSKRYGSYQPHLKALDTISMQIFDAMKKYHNMGVRERIMLRVVAILHDCGKYISIANAADCSYSIIKSSEILGLSHDEREMVAWAVAFNRSELLPYEELRDTFSEYEYMIVVKMVAILKVANALDRTHKQKLKNVSISVRDGKLNITIESKASMTLERTLFAKRADFFESVFSIRPVLKERVQREV